MELLLDNAVTITEHARFPASVRRMSDGHTWRKTAAIYKGGTLNVAEREGPGVKVLVEHVPVTEAVKLASRDVLITTADEQYLIGRGDGCSCGSPLSRWHRANI